MRWSILAVAVLGGASLWAQESALQADFRKESEHIKESCGTFDIKSLGGCGVELATDHPLHVAVGSIAPQNGFGVGGAFVAHYTPNESWRLSWDVDAIGSVNGSWRAGGYMKIIHTPVVNIVVRPAGAGAAEKKKPRLAVHEYTVFNLYAQTTSLNKIYFFGEGTDTTQAGRSVFGMQETIIGGSVVKPVNALGALNLSLLGEVNERLVDVRGNHGESAPSIEQLYNETSAPGLLRQPGFVQFGEGVRLQPTLLNGRVKLNYLINFQQFVAASDSHYSFRRWGIDLGHESTVFDDQLALLARRTDRMNAQTYRDRTNPAAPFRAIAMAAWISRDIDGIDRERRQRGAILFSTDARGIGHQRQSGVEQLCGLSFPRAERPTVSRKLRALALQGMAWIYFFADQGKVAQNRGDVDFNGIPVWRLQSRRGSRCVQVAFPRYISLFASFRRQRRTPTFRQSTPDVNVSADSAPPIALRPSFPHASLDPSQDSPKAGGSSRPVPWR